jgi:hypothetical protein
MTTGTFILIFPCGDRTKIDVADITGTEYERADYDCASVETFSTEAEAIEYGRQLAADHDREWIAEGGELDRDDEEDEI